MTDADRLAGFLAHGDTSIGNAATYLGWTPYRVYKTAKDDKARFSIIGIVGKMSTWGVFLSGNRPIQLVMPEAWRKEFQ